MSVCITEGSPEHDFRSVGMFDFDIRIGRKSISNITSTWAKEHYPNSKYVANYTIINVLTGEVDFLQVYF